MLHHGFTMMMMKTTTEMKKMKRDVLELGRIPAIMMMITAKAHGRRNDADKSSYSSQQRSGVVFGVCLMFVSVILKKCDGI